MIFNVIIIAVFLGIAYFHYAQGFFSAMFSAFCAVIAATMAIAYEEPLVMSLLKGKAANYANAMCLLAIFAGVYIVMRVILDNAIPGQIRLPVIIDRTGGAIMGIIAAIFAAGILAIAGQMMPFTGSIGGYARYPVETREEITIPPAIGHSQQRNADVDDQMVDDTMLPEKRSSLWIPVDDWTINFAQTQSAGGALAGDRTLASIHPHYLDELFAQRLGIQPGGTHTAINLGGKTSVTVPDNGVFRVDTDLTKTQIDSELPQLHQRPVKWTKKPTDIQLVIRVMFSRDAADADGLVRFSPGAIRLDAHGKDYWPVGTLVDGKTLLSDKLDDYLFVNVKTEDRGADFVFFVDPSDLISGNPKDPQQKIKDGVFLQVKRLAYIDLSGREITVGVKPSSKIGVELKNQFKEKLKAELASAAAPVPAANLPFVFSQVLVSKNLFSPINTGTPDKDVRNGQIASGTFALQSRTFTQLNINTTQTIALLKQGSYTVDELYEPPGMKLVQIKGSPPPEGGDPWAWGSLHSWQLVDAADKTYSPAGAWASVMKDQAEHMVASYDATGAPKDISAEQGRPLDVWIAFLVPSGTHLKELKLGGQVVTGLDQLVQ